MQNPIKSFFARKTTKSQLRKQILQFKNANYFIKKIQFMDNGAMLVMALGFLGACSGGAPQLNTKVPNANKLPITLTAVSNQVNQENSAEDVVVNVATDFHQDAIVKTGKGNDIIQTAEGNDIIRSGAGNDVINAGAGNDLIVIIGTNNNAGTYTDADMQLIQGLTTLATLNNASTNDAIGIKNIDGGIGANKLIIYGIVDISKYTIANIQNIDVHSRLILDASQLTNNIINTISGNGDAIVEFTKGNAQSAVINFDKFKNLANIEQLIIGDGVILQINSQNELKILTNQVQFIGGTGSVQLTAGMNFNNFPSSKNLNLYIGNNQIINTSIIDNSELNYKIHAYDIATTTRVQGVYGNDYITLTDSSSAPNNIFIDVSKGKNLITWNGGNSNFVKDTIVIAGIDANDKLHIQNVSFVVLDYNKSQYNQSQYNDILIIKDNQGVLISSVVLGTQVFQVSSLSQANNGDGVDIIFRTQPIFNDTSLSYTAVATGDSATSLNFSLDFPIDPGRNALTITINSAISEGNLQYNDGRVVQSNDKISINELIGLKYTPIAGGINESVIFKIAVANNLGLSKIATITLKQALNENNSSVIATNLADNLNYSEASMALNINGQDGNDSISGSAFNDIIIGGAGADMIYAGAGDDSITADIFDSFINGGSGTDIVNFTHSQALNINYSVNAQSVANLTIGNTQITDTEIINYNANLNNNFIIQGNNLASLAINIATGDITTAGKTITITGINNIVASNFNDLIMGNSNANIIDGAGGVDRIFADAGNDYITASSLSRIDGGEGVDTLDFSKEIANLSLTLTNGAIGASISGIENIIGGAGNDFINGDSFSNVLNGGGGNDIIVGLGNDIVNGGDGNDILIVDLNIQSLSGGNGIDTINFSAVMESMTLSLGNNGALSVNSLSTSVIGIENIIGGAIGDVIIGNDGDNIIDGGNGSDRIIAGAGNDTIFADENDAVLDGGAGNDWLNYSLYKPLANGVGINISMTNSQASLEFESITQNFISITNFENIIGTHGNDIIVGDYLDNKLKGGLGSDNIIGGGGNDWLYIDSFDSLIDGGIGDNYIDFSEFSVATSIKISLNNQAQIAIFVNSSQTSATVQNFINIVGSKLDDNIVANDANNIIYGNDGADSITAGGGNDTIFADNQDRLIDGGSDTDTINFSLFSSAISVDLSLTSSQAIGGMQAITIQNIENIVGTNYDDMLKSSSLVNKIEAGNGNDRVFLNINSVGYDILNGGNGTDWLDLSALSSTQGFSLTLNQSGAFVVAATNSTIIFGAIAEFENIWGGSGSDVIIGDDNNNEIYDGKGNDRVFGRGGDDILYFATPDSDVASQTFDGGDGNDEINLKYLENNRVLLQLAETNGTFGKFRSDSTNSLTINPIFNADWANVAIAAIENAAGTNGFDYIFGNSLDNIIHGLAGNDILRGGGGFDKIYGDAGDDSFIVGGKQILGNLGAEIYELTDLLPNINYFNLDFVSGSRDTIWVANNSQTKNLANDRIIITNFINDDTLILKDNLSATVFFGSSTNLSGYYGENFDSQEIKIDLDGFSFTTNDVITLHTGVTPRAINLLRYDTNFDNIADTNYVIFSEFYDILANAPASTTFNITASLSVNSVNGSIGNDYIAITDNNSNNFQSLTINFIGGQDWLKLTNLNNLSDNKIILSRFGLDDRIFLPDNPSATIKNGFFYVVIDGDGNSITTNDQVKLYSPITPVLSATTIDGNSDTNTPANTAVNLTISTDADWVDANSRIYNLFNISRRDDITLNRFDRIAGFSPSLTVFRFDTNGPPVDDTGIITMSVTNLQQALENISGSNILPAISYQSATKTLVFDLDGQSATNSDISVTFSSSQLSAIFSFVNGILTIDMDGDLTTITDTYRISGGAIGQFAPTFNAYKIDKDKNGSLDGVIYALNNNLNYVDNNLINNKSTVNIANSASFFYDGGSGSDGIELNLFLSQTSLTLLDNQSSTLYMGGSFAGAVQAIENISGTGFDDYYIGNGQNNNFVGRNGNDILKGGGGVDVLLGGEGNDILYADNFDVSLTGDNGIDSLDFTDNLTQAISIVLGVGASNTGYFYGLASGTSMTSITDLTNSVLISGIENITGGAGDDIIIGNSLTNIVSGGIGADQLFGMGGNDVIYFTKGDTVLDGGTGFDLVDLTNFQNAIKVNLGLSTTQIIYSGADSVEGVVVKNFEDITAGIGNDTISGTSAQNFIKAGAGNDIINGLGGTDVINGEFGNDTIFYNGGESVADGGVGIDILDFSNYSGAVNLTMGSYSNSATEVILSNNLGSRIVNFETIIGSNNNDSITGNSTENIINGGNGNDFLRGGLGSNTIIGGNGTDRIISDGGIDIIYGGDINNPNGDNANDVFVWQRNGFILQSIKIMDFEQGVDKIEFTNGATANASDTDFATKVAHQMGFDHCDFNKQSFSLGNNTAHLDVNFYNSPADNDPATILSINFTNVRNLASVSSIDTNLFLALLGNNGYDFS